MSPHGTAALASGDAGPLLFPRRTITLPAQPRPGHPLVRKLLAMKLRLYRAGRARRPSHPYYI